MFEMAVVFDKRFKYVGNDVYIWKLPPVHEKQLKICGKSLKCVGNGSNM